MNRRILKRSLRLTVGGGLFVGVTVILALAAMSSQVNLLFLLFGVCVGAMLLSAAFSRAAVREIDVTRTVPEEAVRGRSFAVTYTIRNRRWWSRVASVRIESGDSAGVFQAGDVYLPTIAAGQTLTVRTRGICMRRGRHACGPIRLSTRYPFGLLTRTAWIAADQHITVFPAIGRIRHDPWSRQDQVGQGYSVHTGGRHGASNEFYGIREYRHGDNLRWIHWRRSARTGQLLVREMAQFRAARVIVLLDAAGDERSPLDRAACEEAVAFTATFVSDAVERGYQVGLLINAASPVVVPPGQGRPHHRRMMSELAVLRPHVGRPLTDLVARVPWTSAWQARCLVVGTAESDAYERAARLLLRRSNAVAILHAGSEAFRGVFEPPPGTPVGAQAA